MKVQAGVYKRQDGMVLLVSLIILISMTLLGLAAIQNTSLEERMAGNLRAENMAFQAAEAALRAAEGVMVEATVQPGAVINPPSSPEVWPLNGPGDARIDLPRDREWWVAWTANDWHSYAVRTSEALVFVAAKGAAAAESVGATDADDHPDDPTAPRYVIEEQMLRKDTLVLGQQRDYAGRFFYQVTARGVDVGRRAESLVRGTYARRY